MSSGRLFQSFGPTEANKWSPTVTRHDARTSSWLEVADRRRRRDGKSATRGRSDRYLGAEPCRARYTRTASLKLMRSGARSQWKLARVSVTVYCLYYVSVGLLSILCCVTTVYFHEFLMQTSQSTTHTIGWYIIMSPISHSASLYCIAIVLKQINHMLPFIHTTGNKKEAQLLQRGRTTFHVVKTFGKSLKVIQNYNKRSK